MVRKFKSFHENVKKMENGKVFVIFLVLMISVMGNGKEICPKMCACDIFEGYKRADCR